MVKSTLQLTGIGLRAPHYAEVLAKRPGVAWLEVHSENYFGDGGKPLHVLEQLRQDYPISLHGVSLSLGSADELNWTHLKKLRDLITRIDPCLVSEHLAWSSINGHYLHDLLPLPYTEEALQHVVARIQQVQEFLNRQILIENISSYVCFEHSTLSEYAFLSEIVKQTGCGILLDVNNLYVTASHLGTDPMAFIQAMPAHAVQEIHLSGHSTLQLDDKDVLIDSHSSPVAPAVWDLYRETIQHLGCKPTIIEWDAELPTLSTLCEEAQQAEIIMRECYALTKRTG